MTTQRELISTFDAEEIYNDPRSSQAKRRMRGDGPAYVKRGTRIFYFRDEYEAWLESLRRSSTSDPGMKSASETSSAA